MHSVANRYDTFSAVKNTGANSCKNSSLSAYFFHNNHSICCDLHKIRSRNYSFNNVLWHEHHIVDLSHNIRSNGPPGYLLATVPEILFTLFCLPVQEYGEFYCIIFCIFPLRGVNNTPQYCWTCNNFPRDFLPGKR